MLVVFKYEYKYLRINDLLQVQKVTSKSCRIKCLGHFKKSIAPFILLPYLLDKLATLKFFAIFNNIQNIIQYFEDIDF